MASDPKRDIQEPKVNVSEDENQGVALFINDAMEHPYLLHIHSAGYCIQFVIDDSVVNALAGALMTIYERKDALEDQEPENHAGGFTHC